MKSFEAFGTLNICEHCIYVSEFAHFKNFCRFSKLWNCAHLVNSAGVAARRPPWEAAAALSILQCARQRSNKESVFCRKLSKIYPPCQNPDRSSYRLLNRLTRVARVFHQMEWADGSKTLIWRAEQYGAAHKNFEHCLLLDIAVAKATQRLVFFFSLILRMKGKCSYLSHTTGSDGVSFLLPQLFFSQQRLKIRK